MTAREYLSQVKTARDEIRALRDRIDDLRYLAGGVGGIDYSAVQVYSSAPSSGAALAAHTDHISPLIDELSDKEKKYVALVRDVEAAIDSVQDPRLRAVLRDRYLLFFSVAKIAVREHYSEQHVKRLHKAALREIDAFLKQETQ